MISLKLRRFWSASKEGDRPAEWLAWRRDIPNVDCAFEYRTPSGEAAHSRDTITLTGAPEENLYQLALLDLENSRRVMLVSS
jgi:hypothetical protein